MGKSPAGFNVLTGFKWLFAHAAGPTPLPAISATALAGPLDELPELMFELGGEKRGRKAGEGVLLTR